MNEARETYLKTYSAVDKIDQMLLGLGVVIAIVVVVIKFGFKTNDPVMPSSNTVSVKLTCFTFTLI